jgi:UDP-glucose 4-epimerase
MSYLKLSGSRVLLGLISPRTMRVLITGGFGFIGSRVASILAESGHDIVISSRTFRNKPLWLPRAEIIEIDWESEAELRKACSKVDIVIHAAGLNSKACESNPRAALDFNGQATNKLARAAVEANVMKFLYLSTAHVYANPLLGKITELTFPDNPHPYATSHLFGEKSVLRAAQNQLMKVVCLRVANVFGSPMQASTNCWMLLVNDLCRQAATNRSIEIRSVGSQRRDFITMSDLCNVIEAFTTNDTGVDFPSVLNIGSSHSRSIIEMAELIQERCNVVLGFSPNITIVPKNPTEDSGPLSFNSLYSSILGPLIANNFNKEIDDLLMFCHLNFEKVS